VGFNFIGLLKGITQIVVVAVITFIVTTVILAETFAHVTISVH
jgi:hypothetical protein